MNSRGKNEDLQNSVYTLHGITLNQLQRFDTFSDKAQVDTRGKKPSSNAIPGEVCIKVFDYISLYDMKTSLFRKNNEVFGCTVEYKDIVRYFLQ